MIQLYYNGQMVISIVCVSREQKLVKIVSQDLTTNVYDHDMLYFYLPLKVFLKQFYRKQVASNNVSEKNNITFAVVIRILDIRNIPNQTYCVMLIHTSWAVLIQFESYNVLFRMRAF